MLTGAPPGSDASAHPSGWMTPESFLKYIEHFVKHVRRSKEHPVVLILDNPESHYEVRVLNKCKNNGIILLTLPPHCSHKLHPLDVSCFYPFKAYYNQGADDWMLNHPGTPMTIYDITSVVGIAYPKAFTPINIIKGFEKTGIAPFNCQIFSDSDVMSSYVTDRPQEKTNANLDVDHPNTDATGKNKDGTDEMIVTTFSQSNPWPFSYYCYSTRNQTTC